MSTYRLKILREDPDFEAAMTWAIGPAWHKTPFQEVPKIWNERHGEIFWQTGNDSIEDGLERMVEAYKTMRSFDLGLNLEETDEGQ